MTDTTIKKVEAGSSPKGEMGQKYLVAGKRVSMRLWIDEPGGRPRLKSTFGAASFFKTRHERHHVQLCATLSI
jgi:hypothetical protein